MLKQATFQTHTSQAAIFKSVLHMGNHCQAQPLCHGHAENVRTNSQGPQIVFQSVRCTQDMLFGQYQAKTMGRQKSPPQPAP